MQCPRAPLPWKPIVAAAAAVVASKMEACLMACALVEWMRLRMPPGVLSRGHVWVRTLDAALQFDGAD